MLESTLYTSSSWNRVRVSAFLALQLVSQYLMQGKCFMPLGFDWIDYRRDGTIQVDIECVFPRPCQIVHVA